MSFSSAKHPALTLHLKSTRSTQNHPKLEVITYLIPRLFYLTFKYLPPSTVPGDYKPKQTPTIYRGNNPRLLPRGHFKSWIPTDQGLFKSKIPHPKPKLWYNTLYLPQEQFSPADELTYKEIPYLHLHPPIDPKHPPGVLYLSEVLDTKGNPYYKKLEIGDIVYNPYT